MARARTISALGGVRCFAGNRSRQTSMRLAKIIPNSLKQAAFLQYIKHPWIGHVRQYAARTNDEPMGDKTLDTTKINKFIVGDDGKPYLDPTLDLGKVIKDTAWYKFTFEGTGTKSERKAFALALDNASGRKLVGGDIPVKELVEIQRRLALPIAPNLADRKLDRFGREQRELEASTIGSEVIGGFSTAALKDRSVKVIGDVTGFDFSAFRERARIISGTNLYDTIIEAAAKGDRDLAIRIQSIGENWKKNSGGSEDQILKYAQNQGERKPLYDAALAYGKTEANKLRIETLDLYKRMKEKPTQEGLDKLKHSMGDVLVVRGDIQEIDPTNKSGENVWDKHFV